MRIGPSGATLRLPATARRCDRALHLWRRHLSRSLLSLLPLLWAGSAVAQQSFTEVQNFPVERLRLSTTRAGLIDVESATVTPHLSWDASLWLGYARDPLVVYRLADHTRLGALVSDRLGGSLMGSLGLFERAEVSLELPLVLYQSRPGDLPDALAAGTTLAPLSGTNIGDLRLSGKGRLLDQRTYGLDLALILSLSLPTGGERAYFGEPGVAFTPELAAARSFGQLRVGANLGAVVRPRTVLLNQVIESELTAHLGAGYRLSQLPLELQASLSAAISAVHPFQSSNQSHLELRAMAAWDATPKLQLFLGGGVGLVNGWGTPDARVFLGGRFGSGANSPTRQSGAGSEARPTAGGRLACSSGATRQTVKP